MTRPGGGVADRAALLRQGPRLSDVGRAGRLLLDEVPRPRRTAALLALLAVAEVVAGVVVALALRALLAGSLADPPRVAAGAVVVALLGAVALLLATRARVRTVERLAVRCRERAAARLARVLHRAGYEDLAGTPMADLREIVMTDVDVAYRFVLEAATTAAVLAVWLLAGVLVLGYLSPVLLGVLAVVGAVVAGVLLLGTRRHLRLTTERFVRLAALSTAARDVVEVDRVVVARQLGLGDLFVREFEASHGRFSEIAERQGRLVADLRATVLSLNAAGLLAVVGTGAALIADGRLDVGGLVAALFVVGQLLAVVVTAGDLANRAAETATVGRRLRTFWSEPPAPPPPAVPAGRVEQVAARDVAFDWAGGPPLLRDVDLVLHRGRPTALTAETGAGKSTLALLLVGLLPPHSGVVAVDGRPELSPADLEGGRVLYVGPRPVLVPGSLRDNLLLDAPGTSSGPRATAADAAPGADDDVAAFLQEVAAGALPADVDAPLVGPNGLGLSSGQSQLVALARAVRRDPDVVVLDEATSALDMETEREVQRRLVPWLARRVSLVISHRTCPWTETAEQTVTLRAADDGALRVVDLTVPDGVRATSTSRPSR